ncbi:MAG: response regulator transcription factor [Candidatus Hydrogenedentes bacterium]|nr:response regulator transcription factor [Candidatus Hydrogenedentota bacterium]
MPVRILIAEHETVCRAGLRALLEKVPEFCVVDEAENSASVIKASRLWETQVLLLDTELPGPPSCRELVRTFQRGRKTTVLIITAEDDCDAVRDLLELGAKGCILKRSTESELIRAVEVVANGGRYIDAELSRLGITAACAEKSAPNQSRQLMARLSLAEQNVCRLLVRGLTHAEVAQKLDLSEDAVESHWHSIMNTLALHSRADLLRFAIDHELLPARWVLND